MSVPVFDGYWAIDWSGAAKVSRSIAVAVCRAKFRSAPELIWKENDPDKPWSRRALLEEILKRFRGSNSEFQENLLIGIDCPLSFPVSLGWREKVVRHDHESCAAIGLWREIDDACAMHAEAHGDDELYARPALLAGPLQGQFATEEQRPQGWDAHIRLTEKQSPRRPMSAIKAFGQGQCALGALSGIRFLMALRSALGDRFAVWPFETPRQITVVEIFPSIFRRLPQGNDLPDRFLDKVRSIQKINRVIGQYESDPICDLPLRISDDDADAMIAAAGMRHYFEQNGLDLPSNSETQQIRDEGWIFGVPLRPAHPPRGDG